MKITKWGLFEISRANVAFNRVCGIKDNSELLTKILPFGSPPSQSVKYVFIGNSVYLSYLKMNDQKGRGIVFAFDPAEIPNDFLGLIPEMTTLVTNPSSASVLEIEPRGFQIEPIRVKEFHIAVFSFLTRHPTIILGGEDEIMNLLFVISRSIPDEIKKHLMFVSQSTSLSENVNIIGMSFSDDVVRELDEAKGNYTIVILGDRVYGQYTSQLCKKIAIFSRKGQYDQIKELLDTFYQMVRESDELPTALEFSRKSKLHLSDAQLALIMRANYFGKEVPSGLLEV